jgi:hypothetical protein
LNDFGAQVLCAWTVSSKCAGWNEKSIFNSASCPKDYKIRSVYNPKEGRLQKPNIAPGSLSRDVSLRHCYKYGFHICIPRTCLTRRFDALLRFNRHRRKQGQMNIKKNGKPPRKMSGSAILRTRSTYCIYVLHFMNWFTLSAHPADGDGMGICCKSEVRRGR